MWRNGGSACIDGDQVSDLVPSAEIEGIVGTARHPTEHWGRAASAEQTFYILHSAACRDSGIDLRDCEFSLALDEYGVEMRYWRDHEDGPVRLALDADGRLIPAATR